MAHVKTTISLQKPLYDRLEQIARLLGRKRSQVYEAALEEFVRRYESEELLRQFNAAYEDGPDAAEQELSRAARRNLRRQTKGEW